MSKQTSQPFDDGQTEAQSLTPVPRFVSDLVELLKNLVLR